MKGIMEVTLGEGLYHIELSQRGIGGQVRRKLPKITLGSVINVQGTPRIFMILNLLPSPWPFAK